MRKHMYQVSLFINTWSKTPTTITFEDFFAMVRNGHWKVPTEGHRSCLAKDRKHDAQTIKDSMACVIPAGICKNGHAKNNLTSLSLALCIDIDHTDEQTKDIFVRACLLEYVLGAFISISGRGVKLFIRIDIDGVNDYPAIYEATAKLVSTVLGVENDGKCKDITHPCFGSYDPDAYYNGDAKAVNDFLPNGALTPRVTYAPVTSAPRTTCTPTSFSNGHPPAMPGNRISAAPFLQSYLTLYPAATGDRNGTVFRLSCAACKRGIDRTELTTELVRTLEEDNFREPEIARTVKSAYQNVMTAAETESFENPPSNSSKVQKSVIGFSENENPAEKEDEIIGEELREQTPTFPDEIYDLIPAIFKECVSIARDERERDGLLLSCITTISSMLPSVNIRYNRRNYQPNIYCIVVASSGANKNLIGYGIRLHKHYCEYWEKQSLKIEKEYKKALRDYTLSLQAIRKKNTATTNLPDEPEEPKLAFPLIPADISRAQLITHLINNQSCSSLLTSTEASSVSTARNQDYGHFDDILCKPVEACIRIPRLAFLFVILKELACFLSIGDVALGIIIFLELCNHRLAHILNAFIANDNLLQLFIGSNIPFTGVGNLQQYHIALGTVIINIVEQLIGIFTGNGTANCLHGYNSNTHIMRLLLLVQLCQNFLSLLRRKNLGVIHQAWRSKGCYTG